MATTSDIRNGMIIKFKNGLYEVVEFLHVKPGKGSAFVRTKLKNVETGQVLDNTFRTSEKLDEVRVEKSKKQYLYQDGEFYIFMDNETYEQTPISANVLGDLTDLLIENTDVTIRTDPEGNVLGIELPTTIVHEIAECEPNVKGNTASGGGKTAVTHTGLKLIVPFFIEEGQKIKIDTRTKEYIERV